MIHQDKENGGNLYKHNRHKQKKRNRNGKAKISIKNRVSIDKRPMIVNNKERFGDWEVDTIVEKNNKGAILTIVERKTAFLIIEKLKHGKNAKELAKTLINFLFIHMWTR